MKNNIKAEIIAHSKRANTSEEIITYKLTFPRIILSEVNTYKMLEKNTSSSRAIPVEKMIKVVKEDPFIPLAFQKQHKGMQGTEYITDEKELEYCIDLWLDGRDSALSVVDDFIEKGVSKQVLNRIMEPWMWVTQLITGSRESFEHLFEQRCPIYNVEGLKFTSKKEAIELYPHLKDMTDLEWLQCNSGQAEIHFMDLAEKMYDALNESTPDILKGGEWHIPFSEDIWDFGDTNMLNFPDFIKMSVCLTAKISYTKIGDENTITLEKAKEMYEKLKNSGHWSCFGHIAKCMTYEDYRSWYKGFINTKTFTNDCGDSSTGLDSNDFLKAQGYNKNLKGFISLRQYVEDGIELKDI